MSSQPAVKTAIPKRTHADQQLRVPALAKLYEVPLDNGTTWTGTERQLRTQHPAWIPYAKLVQPTTTAPDETEDGDYDDIWPTRSPSTARRWQPGMYTDGITTIHVHEGPPPQTHDKQQGRARNKETEEPPTPKRGKVRRMFTAHPLLYLGIGMLLALMLWTVGSMLVTWASNKLDDFTYGYPRVYQIDAVIGQGGDSSANPTHILFLNNYRKVEVIVLPPDTSKTQMYLITTLVEDGSELYPITGYVKDVTGDGKPDIVIIIKGSKTVLINTGIGFRLIREGEHVTP